MLILSSPSFCFVVSGLNSLTITIISESSLRSILTKFLCICVIISSTSEFSVPECRQGPSQHYVDLDHCDSFIQIFYIKKFSEYLLLYYGCWQVSQVLFCIMCPIVDGK